MGCGVLGAEKRIPDFNGLKTSPTQIPFLLDPKLTTWEHGLTSEKKWKPYSLPLSGKSLPITAHPGLAFLALQAAS